MLWDMGVLARSFKILRGLILGFGSINNSGSIISRNFCKSIALALGLSSFRIVVMDSGVLDCRVKSSIITAMASSISM